MSLHPRSLVKNAEQGRTDGGKRGHVERDQTGLTWAIKTVHTVVESTARELASSDTQRGKATPGSKSAKIEDNQGLETAKERANTVKFETSLLRRDSREGLENNARESSTGGEGLRGTVLYLPLRGDKNCLSRMKSKR